MIYIFHNNELHSKSELYPLDTDLPHNSYVYYAHTGRWAAKYERNYLRPVKDKHIPKEIKMLCLIHGIPIK